MKKVILLGSNGQLGHDIIEKFKSSEIELICLTRADLDAEKLDGFHVLNDIGSVDIIINTISYHKTDECEDFAEKSFKINSLFVCELAKYCMEKSIKLIHISTDYVFDGKHEVPYAESDSAKPLNIYGLSKRTGEMCIEAYLDNYIILRVSSLFGIAGASGKGGNFVETMLNLAKSGKSLKVVGDQYMSPTHTEDIAEAIYALIDKNADGGIYHCCGTGSCSWYEFAKKIFELSGTEVDLTSVPSSQYATKAKRPSYSVMDNTRLRRYFEMPKWENSLTKYLMKKGHI